MRLLQPLLQLAELFDFVEDALVWIKDRSGRFVWVNRTVRLTQAADGKDAGPAGSGNGLGEAAGERAGEVSPGFLAGQFGHDDEHVLAGNRLINRTELIRQPDGTTAWYVTSKIPLRDDAGRVIGTAGIARRLSASSQRLVSGTEFGPVLAQMRSHYDVPISNRQLARLAHMSVRTFERRFHGVFHATPQKYLRNLRMRMAAHALVYSDQLLARVALGCGFSDQSHFTREFRRHFGRTPREYRERYSEGSTAAASCTNSAADVQ